MSAPIAGRNGGSMTATHENREPRTPTQGDVVLRLYNPDQTLRGELVDISPHGFRVRHQSRFAVGREVLLSHEGTQVRARAMWSREAAGWVETGFYVL
jgi:PilZ domain-containing protein